MMIEVVAWLDGGLFYRNYNDGKNIGAYIYTY